MHKTLYIITILIQQTLTLGAQEYYNLRRCLETGIERNYDIRITRNQQQISDNNVTPGNAGYLPAIDLAAGYSGASDNKTTQKYTDHTTDHTTQTLNQDLNAGLNLTWTIFDGMQTQNTYRRLKQLRTIGELSTRIAIENLLAGIAAEYYNYVNQNLRLAHLKYAVSLSKERMRIAAEKYNIGSDSRLDMLQAKVDLNADSSNLLKQYETVYTSGVTLNRMMAVEDISQKITVPDTTITPNLTLDETALRTAMKQSNPALQLAAGNHKISQTDLLVQKGRNYPYLKFNAGYGYTLNTYQTGNLRSRENLGLTYGFTLGLNIFDGQNRQREQTNAKIEIENRQLQYEQIEQSLDADLATMLMAYSNNLNLIRLETENLRSARENYEIAIDRYRLGTLSGIELREAQNSLLNAEERLLQAQFGTKICEISLMQISGQAAIYLEK
jgi:outer membrane protein TolC